MASDYFKNAISESLDVYRTCRRLYGVLQYHIDKASDGNEKDELSKAQLELSELRNKMKDIMVKLYRLKGDFEERIKIIDGATRQAVEEKLSAAQKLLQEGAVLESRIYEIGGMVYGEGWRPNPVWIGLGCDFGDEHSIFMESQRKSKSF